MSAERLREAARVLRERAEAANGAPWSVEAGRSGLMEVFLVQSEPLADDDRDPEVAKCIDRTDATFIATMNPTVALAVADWLDEEASAVEASTFSVTFNGNPLRPASKRALATADAILAAVES